MAKPAPSRVAAALDYLERLKSQAAEFGGGVVENLADRARSVGGLAYEALATDPNMGRMTTAEFNEAASRPTPRLDQAAQDLGTIGRAIVTQPLKTGKAIVQGEIDRAQEATTSPRAAGKYAGSFIDPMRIAAALRRTAPVLELDVYHGTPHRFEPTEANPLGEFDASKIGTGEGAQAYGHGIYLAESPGVAESYKKVLTDKKSVDLWTDELRQQLPKSFTKDEFDRFSDLNVKLHKNGNLPAQEMQEFRVLNDTRRNYDDAVQRLEPKGSLYKADLPDEMIDRMLDWDKPLSEQSAAVREALVMIDPEIWHPSSDDFDANELGQSIYNRLMHQNRAAGIESGRLANTTLHGAQTKASEDLRAFGIPGIRYLDAGSRGQGGSGTRNFVVFPGEEKKVKILERK